MRLIIVDDHELIREALQARLELMPGVEVLGNAADGPAALEMVSKLSPDLVILDYNMPRMNGVECARQIKQLLPSCRILFLTGFPEEEHLLDSVGLASGYVAKSASWDMLKDALDAISHDQAFVDPSIVPAIMKRAATVDREDLALRRLDVQRCLTPMEGRVALLAAKLSPNHEIAAQLGVSENTIKAHLQHVFRKLNVHSRKELASRLDPSSTP